MSQEKADIWMPLYIGDYLSATTHLSAEESGGYLHLLMHQWKNGSLPAEEESLRRIARIDKDAWSIAWASLKQFFSFATGVPVQMNLERIRAEWDQRKTKAVAKAEAAARARWGNHAPSIPSSTAQAMPKECPSPSPSPSKDINTLVETDEEPVSSPQGEVIRQVFDYYLKQLKRNPSLYTLTPKRKAKGMLCLKHCLKLTQDDLEKSMALMCDAVDGLTKNDWNMGRKANSTTKYIEWEEHLFRSVEVMEKRWGDFQGKAS